MEKHIVARVSELPEGSRKIVKIKNREIGVFNVDNNFYALKNVCPHQHANICEGPLSGTFLPSEVNKYSYGREGEILRCPWHNWEFDIKTGEALFDKSVKVVTYKVKVEGGNIVLYFS